MRTHVIDPRCAHAQRGLLTYCSWVCLSVFLFSAQTRFSNVYSCQKRYNIPYGRYRSDEFRCKHFIQKLCRDLLTYSILHLYCSGIYSAHFFDGRAF